MQFSKLTKQLLVLMLLSIGAYFFFQHEDSLKSTASANLSAKQRPTAFMEDGKIITYDEFGSPNFVMKSQKAMFYDDQKLIVFTLPHITFSEQRSDKPSSDDYQSIILRAEEAKYNTDKERLYLTGNVTLIMPGKNESLTLETSKMEVDKKTNFISTNEAVTITKGAGLLKANGLKAWANEKKIQLLSNVRGQYDLQNANTN